MTVCRALALHRLQPSRGQRDKVDQSRQNYGFLLSNYTGLYRRKEINEI